MPSRPENEWVDFKKPVNHPDHLARTLAAGHGWVYWNNEMWEWEKTHYELVPHHEVRARLADHIQKELDEDYKKRLKDAKNNKKPPAPFVATRSLIDNTLLALQGMTLIPGRVPMPSLLPDGERLNLVS